MTYMFHKIHCEKYVIGCLVQQSIPIVASMTFGSILEEQTGVTCPLLHMWVCAHPTLFESTMKSLYQMRTGFEFIGFVGPQFTNEEKTHLQGQ